MQEKALRKNENHGQVQRNATLFCVKKYLEEHFKRWLKLGRKPEDIVHFKDIIIEDLDLPEKEVVECLEELERQELLKIVRMGNFSPVKLTPLGWEEIVGTKGNK